jgi:pimeloyl-ACP methyl ester carboxylesterase
MTTRQRLLRITLAVLAAVLLMALAWARHALNDAAARETLDRRQAAPKGGAFLDAGDAAIFAQRAGPAERYSADGKPVLVFVHGTGSWSALWRDAMDVATQAGYSSLAIDLPPFGYSLPPAEGGYSKQRQAQRLLAALDSAGIGHVIFVAHSFGAAPVMEAVMAQPERVAGLILVNGALGLDSAQGDGHDNIAQRLLRQSWLSRTLSAAFLTNPERTGQLVRSFVSEKGKVTPEWINIYQQPLQLQGAHQHIAAWLPELLADRGHLPSDEPAEYAKLHMPVTLIWGETDTITPLSQARNLQKLMPQARLIGVPRAGHIPQIEETSLFRQALAEALSPAAR